MSPEQREAVVYLDGYLEGLQARMKQRRQPEEAEGIARFRETLLAAFPFLKELRHG